MIWLFLLGLSRVANGDYTIIEVVLTLLMAGFSVVGALRSISLGRSLAIGGRLVAVAMFAIAQVAAMWVSFLRPIANL
jgi:hypothetical protein